MKISSVFGPTIQGEGKSSGKRVMFVRLALCNLHCIWCDTPYTWNWTGTDFKHPLKYDMDREVQEVHIEEIVELLQDHRDCQAIVISGGEPLIQQVELARLCTWLKSLGYWIEVETNGTIAPSAVFTHYVDQFNCSPKLSNSGDEYRLRVRATALRALSSNNKTNFKFVVTQDSDVSEILALVSQYDMKEVYLMPEGITAQVLKEREAQVRELCKQHGFKFTQRLHIIELGGGRYV